MDFLYDESGSPYSFIYNGTQYYYVKNLQGDVMRIVNTSGTVVANYTYDAWGKVTNSGNIVGLYNPIRYRGYYYDTDTGFYYLQSRYYDPAIKRFINADGAISGVGSEILGYNQYAYCMNNPVNTIDSDGYWPEWATVALGAAACFAAITLTVATFGAAAPAAACTLSMSAMYMGISATAANALATAAVVGTTTVAAAYAGDMAYSAVTGESLMLDPIFNGNQEAYDAGLMLVDIATAGMTEAAKLSSGLCFVAGTLVATADGNMPIENIEVGMLVYAHNPDTGETALKSVVNTFKNETEELVHIVVNGECITTTPKHPFYVPTKGWTDAIELRAGDRLQLLNGEYVIVEQVQHEIIESPIKVYNFEVEGFHTYYVGEQSVLVHNRCDNSKKLSTDSEARKVAKQLGYSPTNELSHGQKVFVNPKATSNLRYISRDTESHIGGVWKAANSVKNLGNRETRAGTYSRWLDIRMGD